MIAEDVSVLVSRSRRASFAAALEAEEVRVEVYRNVGVAEVVNVRSDYPYV
jgi:hypothetical protein